MSVVFVRIRRLRQGGRLIPDHEAMRPEHQLAGDLSATAARFELRRFMSASGEPAAVLYDAKVLSILAGVIRIRGYEEHRGAAVLQCCRNGSARRCRWSLVLTDSPGGTFQSFRGERPEDSARLVIVLGAIHHFAALRWAVHFCHFHYHGAGNNRIFCSLMLLPMFLPPCS